MVCFCCLFLDFSRLARVLGDGKVVWKAHMVVYLSKDLLGRDHQAHNLPNGHFKVHLRKLEEPLEEARHAGFIAARGGCGAKV